MANLTWDTLMRPPQTTPPATWAKTSTVALGSQAILTDVQARYHRLYGRDVFFLTGTDEHGQKIADASVAKGYKHPLEMIDMCPPPHPPSSSSLVLTP